MAESSGETNVPVSDWTTGTLKIYEDDKVLAVERVQQAELRRLSDVVAYERQVANERDQRYKERWTALEAALKAQGENIRVALEAADKAIFKAEVNIEKRLEGTNEWRASLNDQTRTLIPRAEVEQRLTSLVERIAAQEVTVGLSISRAEYDAQHKTVVDAVTVLGSRIDRSEGRGAGINSGWGYLVGAAGLAATVISIIIATR